MSEPRFKIVVEKGPCAGTELLLTEGIRTVGRDLQCDLVLSGDQFVSAQHARFVSDEHGVVLRNLSPNGTLINGRPAIEAQLAAGDKIGIGVAHLLTVRQVVQATLPPPRPPMPGEPGAPGVRVRAPGVVSQPRPVTRPAPPAAQEAPPPAEKKADARTTGFRMPTWLIVYLSAMVIVIVFFAVVKTLGGGTAGLEQLHRQEAQYVAARKLPNDDTDRLLKLLDTAVVYERRGDLRSAYEAYREMLAVRQPIDPQSPAYRYAAARMAALGPK